MTIKVTVTQEHIDTASVGGQSPIEFALRDAFDALGLRAWWTCSFRTVWCTSPMPIELPLPDVVAEFHEAFFAARPVSPIEFELEIPGWLMRSFKSK